MRQARTPAMLLWNGGKVALRAAPTRSVFGNVARFKCPEPMCVSFSAWLRLASRIHCIDSCPTDATEATIHARPPSAGGWSVPCHRCRVHGLPDHWLLRPGSAWPIPGAYAAALVRAAADRPG